MLIQLLYSQDLNHETYVSMVKFKISKDDTFSMLFCEKRITVTVSFR